MEIENESEKGRSTGQGGAAAARMKEQGANVAEETKRRATEAAQTAANKVDQQRERVAIAFDKTAAALQQHRDKLPDAAQTAADKIQSTADYLHEHDAAAMGEDLKELVRRHPGPMLGAAAFGGFMLAVMFRRRR
ncbi:MAG: hypothetical protein ACRD8A_02230 [Candidatus Acidiferrales bacterium]